MKREWIGASNTYSNQLQRSRNLSLNCEDAIILVADIIVLCIVAEIVGRIGNWSVLLHDLKLWKNGVESSMGMD